MPKDRDRLKGKQCFILEMWPVILYFKVLKGWKCDGFLKVYSEGSFLVFTDNWRFSCEIILSTFLYRHTSKLHSKYK